jgi:hypothetical protein
MRKVSGLERMRWARDAREEAVVGPVRAQLRRTIGEQDKHIRALRDACEAMAQVVSSPIGPQVFEQIRCMLAKRLEPEIIRALGAAYRNPGAVVTVQMSADELRMLRPDQALQRVLDVAERRYHREMSVMATASHAASQTFLRVSLPEVFVELPMANSLPKRRRA